jgi:ArsR family transcriptional regulator
MVELSMRSTNERDRDPGTAIEGLAPLLKILAEPNRLLILNLLMQGVQCNCEIGQNLQMAPNLVSHHMNVLRQAGWVTVERDTTDARWVYFSINRDKLHELHELIQLFFDPARIQSRRPDCGPESALIQIRPAADPS